jgi:Flp pilus assembly protein TadG
MRLRRFGKGESGSAVAEFAVVAGFFLMMMIAIIEFGRLLYTHNALTDATRRGARYAVLNRENAKCAEEVVVYGETNINPGTCAPTGQPLINGLTTANVNVDYEGADDDDDPATPPTAYGTNLGIATVTIQNYTFNLSIPFVGQTLNMPTYRTTLTAESAGWIPKNIP